MVTQLTDKAQQILSVAEEYARRLGHNYLDGDHILYALLKVEDTNVYGVLTRLGCKRRSVDARIHEIVGRGEGSDDGQLKFTPGLKKVFGFAGVEAEAWKHNRISPEHIVLGLILENTGVAIEVLKREDVNLLELREAIESKLLDLDSGEAVTDQDIVLTIMTEKSDGEPPLVLFRTELVGPAGTWPGRFGSVEGLEKFLDGLNAAFGLEGKFTHFKWGRPNGWGHGGVRFTLPATGEWKQDDLDQDENIKEI